MVHYLRSKDDSFTTHEGAAVYKVAEELVAGEAQDKGPRTLRWIWRKNNQRGESEGKREWRQ